MRCMRLYSKGEGVFKEMHQLLDTYPNRKIVLTGANDEELKEFGFDEVPYEFFTLKHDPEKTDPAYYKTMLEHFNLSADDMVYFEHSAEAVKSSQSVGITTHYYDADKKDLVALKQFLDKNL
jgi:FMN phosphatase YigB (HAD superfamily)